MVWGLPGVGPGRVGGQTPRPAMGIKKRVYFRSSYRMLQALISKIVQACVLSTTFVPAPECEASNSSDKICGSSTSRVGNSKTQEANMCEAALRDTCAHADHSKPFA